MESVTRYFLGTVGVMAVVMDSPCCIKETCVCTISGQPLVKDRLDSPGGGEVDQVDCLPHSSSSNPCRCSESQREVSAELNM